MSKDELVERLRAGLHNLDRIVLGGVPHDARSLQAADTIEAQAAEIARLREALELVNHLPEGEWETWDSCSFRRISRVGGGDGDILRGTVQRSDGHPDLSWDKKTCDAVCNFVNAARAALQAKP